MTRNVVIAGAGPAGLLLASLLMKRNCELSEPLYNITVVDNRQNLATFSQEELSKKFRSWMLGLAGHGCEALRTCDGLFKEYVCPVGIQLNGISIHLGTKEVNLTNPPGEEGVVPEGLIIDRNFVVAAIARFVEEKIAEQNVRNGTCNTLYEHKLLYVDYENRRVLLRKKDADEFYLPYDLLVGCDGVRSCVRESMVKRHSTFELDAGDIFQHFKAVHIDRPPAVEEASMHLLPTALPEMSGIGLPETGNKLNVTIGAPRCAFDKVPSEMKSNDPKIVADYVRKNFKAFELVDYEDFAQQWVNQGWNRTGQVHCNFYHSTDINVVLMGDACHATSPSIGMGMNTALRDAQVFYQLLQEHEDNFDLVLPNYSRLRVKEGNALTDLAYYLYCFDTTQQIKETIHMVVRGIFHRMLPSLVYDHPQNMIGLIQYNLSDVYNRAVQLGIIGKHRRINDEMRQAYFEQTTGMVDIDAIKRTKRLLSKTILCALVSAILAYGYLRTTTTTA